MRYLFLFTFLFLSFQAVYCDDLFLKDNLQNAKSGDFIVTARNKNYTVLHIRDKKENALTIEEITIPENRYSNCVRSWKSWVEQNAPHHTAWISYVIEIPSGRMNHYYSHTHQSWYAVNEDQNIFSTLLNLRFHQVPPRERKRRGSGSNYWQPRMIVDGKLLNHVVFAPYRTKWPKDGSELADKMIEIYLPEDNDRYPAYFPFWMQISGTIGKSYVRIIDSGTELHSPKPLVLAQ